MFDLNRMRTTVLDQLQPWRVYAVLRDLRTTDGRVLARGSEFRFELAYVKLPVYDAEIHGLDADDSAVVLESKGGEHREWFEFAGREWRPGQVKVAAGPPVAGGEAEWRRWLSGQADFEDAAQALRSEGRQDWGSARAEADTLRYAARALRDAQPAIARWLAARSLDRYYSWMSQATSGGEGSAMHWEVRSDLEEVRRLAEGA